MPFLHDSAEEGYRLVLAHLYLIEGAYTFTVALDPYYASPQSPIQASTVGFPVSDRRAGYKAKAKQRHKGGSGRSLYPPFHISLSSSFDEQTRVYTNSRGHQEHTAR